MNKRKQIFRGSLVNNNIDLPNLLIGTAAGGVLGLTAALMLNAKPSRKRRQAFYHDIADKIEDFGENMAQQGQHVIERASRYADNIKESARTCLQAYSYLAPQSKLLLLGAISGGLIGASSMLWLKPEAFKGVIKKAGRNGSSTQGTDWIEVTKRMLQAVSQRKGEEEAEEFEEEQSEEQGTGPVQNAIDLALQGIKIWKQLNRR